MTPPQNGVVRPGTTIRGICQQSTNYLLARDDDSAEEPRLPKIRADYEKGPEPKQLIILSGSAHAQYLLQTDQGERVTRDILRFLSAK